MEHGIGFAAVVGICTLSFIGVRFAIAFAKRLEARPHGGTLPDPAIGEMREALDALQERVETLDALQDRVDFLERALVAMKNQTGRALPKGERPDSTTNTPS